MKKRFLVLSLVLVLICNFTVCFAASTVTMYALDGRTLRVPADQISAYEVYGWYRELPKVTLYALDGRTVSVLASAVEDFKAVGWYEQPMTTLYSYDGRTIVVPKSQISAYEVYGWYRELPKVTMYALDGRTISVLSTEVDAYSKVGWYTAPVVKIYSSNGSTAIVYRYELDAYLNNGWNTSPVLNTSSFISKMNGWWVDLSSCRGFGFMPGCMLEFLNVNANNMEFGATYSEAIDYQIKNLTFLGNDKYRLFLYMPGYWYGDYFEPEYLDCIIEYDGGNTFSIQFDGIWYTYTFVGKNHTYDSIQSHPLVLDAMKY